MALTVVIAALAACGVLLVLRTLLEALALPLPQKDVFHVVRLDGANAEHRVRVCLWLRARGCMNGTLIFTDGGLDARAQIAVHTLLRKQTGAVLCAPSQVTDYLKWEKETLGARAD